MNYVPFAQNGYQSMLKYPNIAHSQQRNNLLLNLTIISEALKSSLNNYAERYYEARKQSPSVTVLKQTKISDQSKNISNFQKNTIINLKTQTTKQEIKKSPQLKQVIIAQVKQIKMIEQKAILLYSKTSQIVIQACKNKQVKKHQKNSNNKSNKHSQTFKIKIPELSLLQTAQIPSFKVSFDQLQNKKQKLLKRQVFQWDEILKINRDKRELRMLDI